MRQAHPEGGIPLNGMNYAATAWGDVDDLIFAQENNWLISDR